MKYRLLIVIVLIISVSVSAQVPESYKAEMQRMLGTWIADNSNYMSEQETDDAYAIRWTYGLDNTTLIGHLFGMKDGVKTSVYWQFFQFWDPENKQVRVIQMNTYGTKGEGLVKYIDEQHSQLTQVYVNPDGSRFETGHKTELYANKEISRSYEIKDGKWIEGRHYIWIKQKE
ncbi:MAG: hypothetical protein KJO41_05625 [Bacteroidia bacterium]|nr:hypothetical protein [Bacteroidia bacterium]MBT8278462.1 hypothetical protein [Bacteroidia bacterium]NND24605.1 hypothetical protein [Flavobacteriaceae bacterium]NNL31853.1 hypothetical protein [Flavobacteriaceae bacterium]